MRWVDHLLRQSRRPATRKTAKLGVLSLEDRSVPSVAGFVFRDLDGDGARDVGTPTIEANRNPPPITPRTEPGLGGVTVRAFTAAGVVPVETTVTAADGSYNLATNLTTVRIEFGGLPAGYAFGSARAQAVASSVRFESAAANPTNVNVGAVIPAQANPFLVTPQYSLGNPTAGVIAPRPAVVAFPYNATGNTGPVTTLATAGQVGATWAVAANSATGDVYAGAFMKRYAGFGPNGTGAIYKMRPTFNNLGQVSGALTPVLFADLSVVLGGAAGGAAGTTGANPHPNTFTLGQFATDDDGDGNSVSDLIANDAVGKIGLGGMAMSADNTALYVMNLTTRKLVRLGVDAFGNYNGTHAEFPVPVPAGTADPADVRPFAVQVRNGLVYVGLVDSAESTGNRADLDGFVYAFNPGSGTFSPTPVLQFDLDYAHGDANTDKATAPPPDDQPNNGDFQPWANVDPSNNGGNYYAQPVLADIVFDDSGAMIVGVRDREGDQSSPGTNPHQLFGTAGDVLRANSGPGGTFLMEGQPGGPAPTVLNGEGPGGGEFYADDRHELFHEESATGGLAFLPGSGQVAVNSLDPGSEVYSAGPVWMDNATGRERDNFQVYREADTGTFGKANGLGDLHLIYAPGTLALGNRVWLDNNDNGVQDAAEPGIAGVTVQLRQGGLPVGTTVTNVLGEYSFDAATVDNGTPGDTTDDGVRPNTAYQIQIPAGQPALANRRLTAANAGADHIDSDGTDNGSFVSYDLTSGAAGTFNYDNDFGFVPRLSLGNRVWNDVNNNGLQDPAEPGVVGVEVQVLNAAGTVLDTEVTGANGVYEFTGLAPGDYRVRLTAANFGPGGVLAGFTSSVGSNAQVAGPFETTPPDPDINPADTDDNGFVVGTLGTTGVIQSALVTLADGLEPVGETPGRIDTVVPDTSSNLTVDFGVFQKHTIGNVVFVDNNNNGVQDAADLGVANVAVNLFDATSGNQIANATTNAQGLYLFTNVSFGDYVVEIAAANFNGGGPLAGFRSSTGAANASEPPADPDNNADGVDDGTTTGTLGAGGVVRSLPITLAATEPINESPDNDGTDTPDVQGNLTVDFGFFRPLSLGNQVFDDVNTDGIRQPGEGGYNNITVQLINDLGGVIATTTTANVGGVDGIYRFNDIPAGRYRVRLAASNFVPGGPLTDERPSPVVVADPNNDINDDNNGLVVGTLGANGYAESGFIDLSAGNEPVTDGDADANSNLTVDFGLVSNHSIGNRVFNDVNNNGLQDPGEAGLSNVTVQLLDASATTVLQTTTTDLSGLYLFTRLGHGTYVVRIPGTNFTGALAGFSSSTGNPGFTTPTPFENGATPDPDANPADNDDNGTTAGGNVQSLPIDLADNEPLLEIPNNDPAIIDGQSNLTVDFGFFQRAALNGRVYIDADADGVIDPTETAGVAGVTITAVGPTGTFTATTAADGSYSIPNVPAGSYTVTETQPAGYGSSTPNTVTVVAPVNGTGTVNFGETRGSLSGRVFLNYNNQPDFNGPDAPIAGVLVTLTGTEANGTPIVPRNTFTDAQGNYTFDNVAGGTYSIAEQQPIGGTFPPNADGIDYIGTPGSPGTAGLDSFAVTLPAGTSATGYNFTEVPLVNLTGSVFEDLNGNGLRDGAEPGIPNVTVTLTGTNVSGAAVNTPAVTAADGTYTFTGVQPSTNYTVTEGTVPAPFLDGRDQNGVPAATNTGVNDVFGGINLTSAAGGGAGYNFGEVRPVSLAGRVYVDANNNGLIDGTENGIPLVTVRLTGTDDTGAAVNIPTTTVLGGAYSFPNLRPGTYTVTEVQPSLFGDGLDTQGDRGGIVGNDVISNVVLTSGQAAAGYNFGESNSVDLQITQTVSRSSVKVGETVIITYTVRNNGPATATGVFGLAPLLGGLRYVATVVNQQGTYNAATGRRDIGTLAPGEQVQLAIQVRLTQAGVFTNPASVQGAETETTLANNFANVRVTATLGASQVTKRRFLSSSFR